jgi:PKD repeat protein
MRLTTVRFACAAFVVGAFCAACGDSAPAAPSTSTAMTLTLSATQLPFNGTASVVAQLVGTGGQPPPDGTLVTFDASLGSFEPPEAATTRGQATVTFLAGAVSGTAVISARSGAATAGADGTIRIAIGAAAVSRITMTANPTVLPFSGGSSAITATAVDGAGNPLPTIPITFSTSAGTLTFASLKTDAGGNAQTTLTTTAQARVTASVGATGSASGNAGAGMSGSVSIGVGPRPQPTVTVTPGPTPTALSPTVFTVTVTPAANSGATIQNVTIEFGDGGRFNFGAASGTLTAQHVYEFAGTYTVTVTVVDSAGGSAVATTLLVVAPAAPLSVAIVVGAPVVAGANTIYTFSAVVAPETSVIASYVWKFGDGGPDQTTTGNQVSHSFRNGGGPYTVQVTITSTQGRTADTFTIINP